MHGIDQHIIYAPGVHAQAGNREIALSHMRAVRFSVPQKCAIHPIATSQARAPRRSGNRCISSSVQPAILQPAQHHPTAFCAEIASDVVTSGS